MVSCSSKKRFEVKKNHSKHELSQNYTNLKQDLHCGEEPIVRFANFTFDKKDSLKISVDITTSLAEQKVTGSILILLDEYELEYANNPTSKQYVETLELESHSRYPHQFRSRQSLANILISSATRKAVTRDSQKQYWNTVSIVIEPEDESLILASLDVFFSIKTKKCKLMIYPSYDQVKELKRFLR
ncbi:MAG: hypothetical protein ACJATI_004762 [Halioglobus sp.]|jgi:hypothetical protein